jgi:hypothetical protein
MAYLLCNGFTVLNLTDENKSILDMLIKCVEEADSFIGNFLMCARNENGAVSSYRLHRILERSLSYEEFTFFWSQNRTNCLEQMFLCPVKEFEVELLTNKINDGILTLEKFFHSHKEDPRARLFRLLP